jgi:hypothetical protein
MDKRINNIYIDFLNKSIQSDANDWQSVKIETNNPMYEIQNLFFELDFNDPIEQINPDVEWCKIHFQERVGGSPLNPGESYKAWPYYYKGINNDDLFRSNGGIFSHTYMERFWPKYDENNNLRYGIRYLYGDLNDVIERLYKNKSTRQAFLGIWHPEDQSNNNVRVPCTIGYWFKVNNNKLDCTYLIRSCDIVRHFRNDIYLTYLLMRFVAVSIGVEIGKLNMWVGSLHSFKSDFYYIKNTIIK